MPNLKAPPSPLPSSSPSSLTTTLTTALHIRRQNSTYRTLTIPPPDSIDFSSNDFLSLSHSPLLRTAFLSELHAHPAFPVGSGGSRLLDGNSPYAEALERSTAEFHGAEAGLLCNSGYDANVGLFGCVPQAGDVVVWDELVHASVREGMRLSRAAGRTVMFRHNDCADLRRVLTDVRGKDEKVRDGKASVFVAVEAIYSMDGDLVPLKRVVDVVDEVLPRGNGHIIVDEAHSTGVLGPLGKGLVCQEGLENRIFARLHTFGKSMACSGAIILCSPLVRSYLINYSRPVIYTTFMPFPNLAAIQASYSLLKSGEAEPLAARLHELVQILFHRLQALAAKFGGVESLQRNGLLTVPSEIPGSPVFALLTDHPRSLATHCQKAGYMVRAVVPPTVPEGTSRIRVCLHAGNNEEQIEGICSEIEKWLTSWCARLQCGEKVTPEKDRPRL
ncbi:PLP-dependent transferase [Eremomyces bilateralis CBS 781.70]|uniref:PLP-dependent transferase n=1 Tax=Eremomyces bilateralis CBS 781.70 TaxID=1392243 RepID=A0A6G1GHY6_9PEZI|nr:PLP-dependent transferase [Eremomyces bilateralis CBS 781.70]KAF1817480.1 PLP-dependent transferase [Eremomyces bilateralis CBS 781.70]